MTQREVVGEYITRNMLSKIENNSATPSVKTLEYLAAKLGLPAGYFVSEELVAVVPESMQAARQAYAEGKYTQALEWLGGQQEPELTDEQQLLLARCHLALAEQSSRGEDAAKTLFHARMARECNRRTLYASAGVEAEAALLLARYDAVHYTEEMEQYRRASRSLGLEHQYRLTLIQHYLNVGDMTQAAAELDALAGESASTPEEQGDYLRLRGELAMRSREYQTAAEQLRRAEQLELSVGGSESALGPLYAMLEQCYREMEDYKEAYRYAAKQIPR